MIDDEDIDFVPQDDGGASSYDESIYTLEPKLLSKM
jgi:hypothetical protein